MSDITVGAPIRLTYVTRIGPVLTDATSVTVNIRKPDGTNEAPFTMAGAQVIRDSVGTYHYDYLPSQSGHYDVYWISTGTAAGTLSYIFDVAAAFPTGLATLDDVKDYLNMSTTITTDDDELTKFLEAASGYVSEITGFTGQPKTMVTYPYKTAPNVAKPSATIVLSDAPIALVTSIVDNFSTTVDPSRYVVNANSGTISWVWYPPTASMLPSYSWTVTYLLPPIPSRIHLAVLDLTADLWRSQRGATAGSKWHTGAALTVDELGGPMPRWKTLLAQDGQDTVAFG
jgi:hypothetical protein